MVPHYIGCLIGLEYIYFRKDKINRIDKVCHLEELFRNPLFFFFSYLICLMHFGIDHN